jgi:Cof subfamily protein (haloacid dehalogenase superfamily)
MKYKLLVLDLDGTLLNSNKIITEYTKKTLINYQKSGGTIVLASGRPTIGVEPLARELKLDQYHGYILSFNGGCVIECESGKVIYKKTLPTNVLPQLSRFAKKHKVNIMTYEEDALITEKKEDKYVELESRINKLKIKEIECFEQYVTFPVIKCLMVEEGDYLAEVEKKLQAEVGDYLSVYRSEEYFLEIMPQNIDKAVALKQLLDYLNLTKDQIIACGDGFNDISMISFAGLGVAMKNAKESVKKAANYIAPTNDEDGVAYVVNKFQLSV